METMKGKKSSLRNPSPKRPVEVLEKFIGLFSSKGWLNQSLRIRYRDRRYRVSCSEMEFLAYRINDYCGVSPGFPGWLVGLVTQEDMLEDSDLSELESTEPSLQDWFQCFRKGDFELI
jgi:hypothetical protein